MPRTASARARSRRWRWSRRNPGARTARPSTEGRLGRYRMVSIRHPVWERKTPGISETEPGVVSETGATGPGLIPAQPASKQAAATVAIEMPGDPSRFTLKPPRALDVCILGVLLDGAWCPCGCRRGPGPLFRPLPKQPALEVEALAGAPRDRGWCRPAEASTSILRPASALRPKRRSRLRRVLVRRSFGCPSRIASAEATLLYCQPCLTVGSVIVRWTQNPSPRKRT